MKLQFHISAALLLVIFIISSCSKADVTQMPSTKRERNAIKAGNANYREQRYADAEISYKKALEENPDNYVAQFNLASSYIKQRGNDVANKADSLIRTADVMLAKISTSTENEIAQKAFYDRGNLAYKAEDYAAAIEQYKNALRRNPDDEQARENLRLAQLKKQEQDNQQQNQDQNNQDQNQDQNQQNNEDQNQNENNQNQDQNKDNDQDKNQNQQNNQNQDNKEQEQKQGGLSDASAQQILKAMEDKENGTRQKVELMKQGEEKRVNRRTQEKPW